MRMFRTRHGQTPTVSSNDELRCSFCNKAQNEVAKLIAGPSVFICDECVQVCNEIVAAESRRKVAGDTAHDSAASVPGDQALAAVQTSWSAFATARCTLCGMEIPSADGLAIPMRGVLCPGCVGEIEATLAERTI